MTMLAIAMALTLMEGEFYHECRGSNCKEECQKNDTLRLLSCWKGKLNEAIQIQECGNEFLVRFYVVEFSCFKAHEIVTLLPVEDVSVSNSVITMDRHGKARLIMFTEQPRRKMKVLDFTFRYRNENHTMSVNKLIAEPYKPEVIETQKAKPVTRAMLMPGKRV